MVSIPQLEAALPFTGNGTEETFHLPEFDYLTCPMSRALNILSTSGMAGITIAVLVKTYLAYNGAEVEDEVKLSGSGL